MPASHWMVSVVTSVYVHNPVSSIVFELCMCDVYHVIPHVV